MVMHKLLDGTIVPILDIGSLLLLVKVNNLVGISLGELGVDGCKDREHLTAGQRLVVAGSLQHLGKVAQVSLIHLNGLPDGHTIAGRRCRIVVVPFIGACREGEGCQSKPHHLIIYISHLHNCQLFIINYPLKTTSHPPGHLHLRHRKHSSAPVQCSRA